MSLTVPVILQLRCENIAAKCRLGDAAMNVHMEENLLKRIRC